MMTTATQKTALDFALAAAMSNRRSVVLAWTLFVLGVALALYGLAQKLSAPGGPTEALAIANRVASSKDQVQSAR